ncbi:CAP domain-containing protein [Bacillus sp. SM2101]|uniref:CAP domain-containing protein n=1 Tax=Bacillus sp. SM2101 TaxID=2805366 RepID=UPI001BDE1414|nr:CAP domain-containing protein [Bacillus sp. SM2101]
MSINSRSYYKFLAGSISAALVATAVVPADANAESIFPDLSPNDQFYNEITNLVEKGVIKGYEDGTFKPHVELTRGQAAKLFKNILNLEVPEELDSFEDVSSSNDKELKEAVAAVRSVGIFIGSNGKFNAGDTLTRAQMATILVRAFGLSTNDEVEVTLSDLQQINESHRGNVAILFQNGVTIGKSDGTYDGNGSVTRSNFAGFLYRAFNQEVGQVDEEVDPTKEEGQSHSYVASVSADNLKKIEISFNEDINIGSLTNSTVKVLNEANKELKVVELTVVDGNKVAVILETGELEFSDEVTVVLDGIKTVDNNNVEYEQELTVRDVTIPELLDVKVLNAKQIELSFNEPVSFSQSNYSALSEITIDGKKITAKATPNHATNTVILELSERLNTKDFELKISNIEDFNDYQMSPQDVKVEVDDDILIPEENETQNSGDDDSQNPRDDDTQNPGDDDTEGPGNGDTQDPGDDDTQDPGDDDTQDPGDDDTQDPGDDDTQNPGDDDTQDPGDDDTQGPGDNDTQDPGDDDTQGPGDDDTQNPGDDDTQNSEDDGTQDPGDDDSDEVRAEFVNEVVNLVNIEREAEGLDPLTLSDEVTDVAQVKAKDMRDNNYFDHVSPTYGEPGDMLINFGVNYRMSGENIAAGHTTPEDVVEGWMNSEGHRENILRPAFTEIGIGYIEGNEDNEYSTYWVQMFILPF